MQCSSVLSGTHALQIFRGQDQSIIQKSPYIDLYINIFSRLSTFNFNRCYLVCRRWKEFCSIDILCENRVKELINQIFSIKPSCHIQKVQPNPEFFSSRQQFDRGIVKYDEYMIAVISSNLKKQNICSLQDFACNCHEQMIKNRQQLLDLFSAWLPTIEPGYDGILRVTFFGCNKFYFEVHCLFLKGSDNMHYAYLPSFFDPSGHDMNEVDSHITSEKSFGRNRHFKSLSIHFEMPVLAWSLDGICEDLSQIFDTYVDDLAENIFKPLK